jgi:hypothetical protein
VLEKLGLVEQRSIRVMGFVFPSPATARAGQHKDRQGFCPKAREDSSQAFNPGHSKIDAEVKDPVVLVLRVRVADGKLVAHPHGPC